MEEFQVACQVIETYAESIYEYEGGAIQLFGILATVDSY